MQNLWIAYEGQGHRIQILKILLSHIWAMKPSGTQLYMAMHYHEPVLCKTGFNS